MGKQETQVSDQIRDYLEGKGFMVFRMQSGRFRGAGGWITMNPVGTPDLFCIQPVTGRVVAIETKTPIGKATSAQKRVIDEINALGGFAMIAHSLADVVNKLVYEEPI